MSKIPEHVQMIIFVVATFTGHLRDVVNGKIHVLEDRKENEVACFQMKDSAESVDVVAMMVRSSGWSLCVVDVAPQPGRHFMDILEPTVGELVRGLLPGAPRRLKVAFAMEKGAVVDLPQSSEIKEITAGLGWDTLNGNIDLDVSAVLFDAAGKAFEAVFFGNLESSGLEHSGDNLTGEGSGDDETIRVGLEQVAQRVQQIFFVVNIYTKGKTFEQVANPYCRIMDPSGAELARYELQDGGAQTGLIIARLFRSGGGIRWGFQAIGSFCRGNTWKDSVVDVAPLFAKTAQQLQTQGAFTRILTGLGAAEESGARASDASPPQKSGACTTM